MKTLTLVFLLIGSKKLTIVFSLIGIVSNIAALYFNWRYQQARIKLHFLLNNTNHAEGDEDGGDSNGTIS